MPFYAEERRRLVEAAREAWRRGLNPGTSGNLSIRIPTGCLVTPSALPYEVMGPEDLVEVDWEGRAYGRRKPTSEWRFHLEILRTRPDDGAVVHSHAPFVTALSCLERGIPPFHYMVAAAGGSDIRCAPYRTFGTPELAADALEALRDRRACLLAHHGMICTGRSLDTALDLAFEVENLAAIYLRILPVREPPRLDDAEMARVLERFRSYRP